MLLFFYEELLVFTDEGKLTETAEDPLIVLPYGGLLNIVIQEIHALLCVSDATNLFYLVHVNAGIDLGLAAEGGGLFQHGGLSLRQTSGFGDSRGFQCGDSVGASGGSYKQGKRCTASGL
jgi:hypothetical protein